MIVEVCPKEDREIFKPHLEQWKKTIKPDSHKVCLPGHRMHALLEELYKQGHSIIMNNIFVFCKPLQRPTNLKENDDGVNPLSQDGGGAWRRLSRPTGQQLV